MTKVAFVIQVAGATVLLVGSWTNLALYILGVILLFPGSILAPLIPLHSIAPIRLLSLTGSDGWGLENVMYLPLTIVINCGCIWLINLIAGRRLRSNS